MRGTSSMKCELQGSGLSQEESSDGNYYELTSDCD